MAATLGIFNEHMKRKRDDVTWNMETLVTQLKKMIANRTLHTRLVHFVGILKRYQPKRLQQRLCPLWITHDEYENNVLYDEFHRVSYDFERATIELARIANDAKEWIHDEQFMYLQVEMLIENVLDKSYYWE